jgi:hypothetical protein
VRSGLRKDGSVTTRHGEVTIPEYYRRYRKWRRLFARSKPATRDDFARIDSVTGWKHGCDHWFLRFLGFGPRPPFWG